MHVIFIKKNFLKGSIIAAVVIIIGILIFTIFGQGSVGTFFLQNKKVPIYCVDTKEKKIAITFDTSWGEDNTIKILDILDKNNVKSTFFVVGRWADAFPEQTKAIVSKGHEIGNHSDKHPDFSKLTKEQIVDEIAIADAKLMAVTGKKPELFRCPEGTYNDLVIDTVEQTNHKCVQWDVDSIDWKDDGADLEYNRVINKVKPGSILLFHNSAKYTPENLSRIIKKLKGEGYTFVKVSDLIYKDNYYIDYDGKQIKK